MYTGRIGNLPLQGETLQTTRHLSLGVMTDVYRERNSKQVPTWV